MFKPINIEQRELVDILIWIAQLGDNIQESPPNVQKILAKTAVPYRKINSRELETLLKGGSNAVNMSESHLFIYLPPPEKGDCFVPIMCIEYDYEAKIPELHLRIALFYISEKDGMENLEAIGYRFETPHDQERHRYCHIQHINALGEGTRYKLPATAWIPLEYPAFPIDAQDPVELLVCFLVSLYDINIIKNLSGVIKNHIAPHVKKMRLSKFLTQI